MANQQLTDRYQSTLASGYTSGGTSLSVTSAGTLETSGDYYMVVEAEGANTEEVFKCTSRSGTTLTVVGAQAGTSASDHASSAIIKGVFFTKDMLKGVFADAVQVDTYANLGAVLAASGPPINRSRLKATDNPYEWIWNGSIWVPFLNMPGGGQVTVPNTTGFAWHVSAGSPSTSNTYGPLHFTVPVDGSHYQYYTTATGVAATYTMTALVDMAGMNGANVNLGLGLWQSSDNKGILFAIYSGGVAIARTNADFTWNSTAAAATFGVTRWMWLRIQRDGTNNVFSFSINGQDWNILLTEARNVYITADQIGYAFFNNMGATIYGQALSYVVV